MDQAFTRLDYQAFHAAVSRNDIDAVSSMLEAGMPPEAATGERSPLFVAATDATPAMVDLLVSAGANPNVRLSGQQAGDTALRTALNGAAMYGAHECMARLLDHGADPRALDDDHRSALHLAIIGADFNAMNKDEYQFLCTQLSRMLDMGADPNQRDKQWQTPLHHAVILEAPYAVLEILLARGADPHLRDHESFSPAHWTLRGERKMQADVFRRNGVDLEFNPPGYPDPLNRNEKPFPKARRYVTNTPKSLQFSALDYRQFMEAVKEGNVPVVQKMLTDGVPVEIVSADSTAMFNAAFGTSVAMVDLLVKHRADPNRILPGNRPGNSHMRTALNNAATNGKLDVLERLLDHGADPRLTASNGQTAGHLLVMAIGQKVVPENQVDRACQALGRMFDLGLPVNQIDELGWNILGRALLDSVPEKVIDFLLERGSDPLCPANTGRTPFHISTTKERCKYLATFVNHGVQINTRTVLGEHLLHLCDNEVGFEAIMALSPDIDTQDIHGRTPLADILNRWGNKPWIGKATRLIASGASADIKDHHGITPRDLIKQKNLTDVAAVLAAREARGVMEHFAALRKGNRP